LKLNIKTKYRKLFEEQREPLKKVRSLEYPPINSELNEFTKEI